MLHGDIIKRQLMRSTENNVIMLKTPSACREKNLKNSLLLMLVIIQSVFMLTYQEIKKLNHEIIILRNSKGEKIEHSNQQAFHFADIFANIFTIDDPREPATYNSIINQSTSLKMRSRSSFCPWM